MKNVFRRNIGFSLPNDPIESWSRLRAALAASISISPRHNAPRRYRQLTRRNSLHGIWIRRSSQQMEQGDLADSHLSSLRSKPLLCLTLAMHMRWWRDHDEGFEESAAPSDNRKRLAGLDRAHSSTRRVLAGVWPLKLIGINAAGECSRCIHVSPRPVGDENNAH